MKQTDPVLVLISASEGLRRSLAETGMPAAPADIRLQPDSRSALAALRDMGRPGAVVAAVLPLPDMSLPAFLAALPGEGQGPAGVLAIAGPGATEDETSALGEANLFLPPVRAGALVDRARALLRRHLLAEGLGASVPLGPYDFSWRESLLTRRGTGAEIRLTDKERDILLTLYRRRPAVTGRKQLLDDVWGYAEGVQTHTLETHIYRLRQKIEEDAARPALIVTKDSGYCLAC